MNSYNENLNAVVLANLQNQRLAEKTAYSKLNAAMFTLYYAEGATISAGEKLQAAKADMITKEAVKNATVNNTNMSNNLLASAKQANQYYKQSINNMAVCAANVQVAANSIVKLAGDVGSIFSIVNAADRYSDIYKDTLTVRDYIDDTAHTAEVASKLAMDASMYTSEVSVPTVLDKSTSTNAAINNLLAINSKAFNDASTLVNTDNATLATVSAKEKLAEGELEDITIDYRATKQAYNSSNRELNLDLWVGKIANTNYRITFSGINNPFSKKQDVEPVQNYHLIVVKDSKKATFSISNAEVIRQNNLDLGEGVVSQQFLEVNLSNDGTFEKSLDFLNYPGSLQNKLNPVIDSDGDPLKLGLNYVVFVMAVFTDQYKRMINNFNDFLSAPSKEFMLTNTLRAVNGRTVRVEQLSHARSEEEIKIELDYRLSNNIDIKYDFEFQEDGAADYTHKVTFNTMSDELYNPIHRCIFLPAHSELNDFLLTRLSLQSLIEHSLEVVHDAENVADVDELEVRKYEKEVHRVEESERETKGEIGRLEKLLAAEPTDKNSKKWREKLKQEQEKLDNLITEKATTKTLLTAAREREKAAKNALADEKNAILPFLFNLSIAEQVSPSNYTQMKQKKNSEPNPSDIILEKNWYAFFGPETTDNFGNFLIPAHPYYPVILTVSKDEVDHPNNYTNVISQISVQSMFTFELKKPIKNE